MWKELSRQAGQLGCICLRITVLRIAYEKAENIEVNWRGIIVEKVKLCSSWIFPSRNSWLRPQCIDVDWESYATKPNRKWLNFTLKLYKCFVPHQVLLNRPWVPRMRRRSPFVFFCLLHPSPKNEEKENHEEMRQCWQPTNVEGISEVNLAFSVCFWNRGSEQPRPQLFEFAIVYCQCNDCQYSCKRQDSVVTKIRNIMIHKNF